MLEHLTAIRRDTARMADDIRGLRSEMTATQLHVAGVTTLQDNDHGEIADLKLRVDRIEQRLDLVD